MTVTLSIAITHAPTPERKEMLGRLLRSLALDYETAKAQLVDFSVIVDKDFKGVWPTAKRALVQGMRAGATHHLVLQDDALACKDFIAGAKTAISYVSGSPIVFSSGHPYTDRAYRLGLTWTRLERCEIGCVAVAYPTPLIGDLLAWVRAHFDPSYRHDDVRIEAWAYLTGNYLWATDPSLVKHAGVGRSLLGHDNHASHVTRRFIGEDASALDIDFSLGATEPVVNRAKMAPNLRKVLRG